MNLQIKERLEETLKKYGISQNRAAKDIGYVHSAVCPAWAITWR